MSVDFSIIYKTHPRARRLSMRVISSSKVVVTAPRSASKKVVEKFVDEQYEWIETHLKKMQQGQIFFSQLSVQEVHRAKIVARQIALNKLLHFNKHYQFRYDSVSIRSQRTRWGSCSRRRHLSFNYRLAFLPEELVNYIIVHELCHLQQMNHSKSFWLLVAETIPDYAILRRKLRQMHLN